MAEICFTADLVVAPGGIPGAFLLLQLWLFVHKVVQEYL